MSKVRETFNSCSGLQRGAGHLGTVTSFPTYKIMALKTIRPPLLRTQDNLLVSIENKRVPKDFCPFSVKTKTEKKKNSVLIFQDRFLSVALGELELHSERKLTSYSEICLPVPLLRGCWD